MCCDEYILVDFYAITVSATVSHMHKFRSAVTLQIDSHGSDGVLSHCHDRRVCRFPKHTEFVDRNHCASASAPPQQTSLSSFESHKDLGIFYFREYSPQGR